MSWSLAARRPRRGLSAGCRLLVLAVAACALAPAPARATEPDYSGYQALLKKYVQVLKPGHAMAAPATPVQAWTTRFDYSQLYIDENVWTLHRADGLAAIHTQLLSVSPEEMTPRERTAWAINTYNLLVIERLTVHLLVPGRKFMRYDSPKQVNNEDGTFFAAVVAMVAGQPYTLTGFERRFVYGDTAADPVANGTLPRDKPGDPRLMCALSKGAMCTGPILPWAYRSDSLEAQLDRAARIALASPAYLKPDRVAGTLAASNRFFDERADFGGPQMPGLMPFLGKYGPLAARRVIVAKKLVRPSIFFEPDWKLNQVEYAKPKLPGAAGADSTKVGAKS